jgi:hypothetical protein
VLVRVCIWCIGLFESLLSVLKGAVKSYHGLLATRFFLGALEGGLITFYLLMTEWGVLPRFRWTLPRYCSLLVFLL